MNFICKDRGSSELQHDIRYIYSRETLLKIRSATNLDINSSGIIWVNKELITSSLLQAEAQKAFPARTKRGTKGYKGRYNTRQRKYRPRLSYSNLITIKTVNEPTSPPTAQPTQHTSYSKS